VRRPAAVLRAWADKEAKPQQPEQPQSEAAESSGPRVNYFTNLSLKAVNEASSGAIPYIYMVCHGARSDFNFVM
jgi:hypothetical protein